LYDPALRWCSETVDAGDGVPADGAPFTSNAQSHLRIRHFDLLTVARTINLHQCIIAVVE
jgi:hypothetical protein